MRVFAAPEELRECVGESLGESDWLVIDQERIDTFAKATDDFQWIHTDPERAASGPYGTTVAHGYLTLSLLPFLMGQIFSVAGSRLTVNYGLNKARFITPVRVGSKVRARTEITEVSDVADALQAVLTTTIEIEGEERPALVAESIRRFYL